VCAPSAWRALRHALREPGLLPDPPPDALAAHLLDPEVLRLLRTGQPAEALARRRALWRAFEAAELQELGLELLPG